MFADLIIVSVAGFIGGFIGSQVGAGAIITLPALLFIGMPLPLAVGTNTLSGWLINVVAGVKYWRNGKVHLGFIVPLAIVASVGAWVGAQLLFIVDTSLLSKISAFIFCFLGIAMLIQPKNMMDKNAEKLSGWRLWAGLLLAFILGLYGGILSVGLATFAILAFNLILKQPRLEAIANAVTMSAVLLTSSTLFFILNDKISYTEAVPLAITSMIGSYVGAHVVMKKSGAYFKALLLFVLALVILKLLFVK